MGITYFDFDSATLIVEKSDVLERAIDKFLKNPSARVVTSEKADQRGTRAHNLALGHPTASVVPDYLVAIGIDGLRIKNVLFGREKPLLEDSNDEACSNNRRVKINGE